MKRRIMLALFIGPLSLLLAASAVGHARGNTAKCGPTRQASSVKLTALPVQIMPGAKLRFRVENIGNETVRFGNPFSVEQCAGGRCSRAAFSLRGPWLEVETQVLGGGKGPWEGLRVPAAAAPGEYRVRKNIGGYGSARPYFGLFRILGPHG